MAEVLFYHLTESTLDEALPPLLEKSVERGWRVVVQSSGEERRDALDAHLWTWRDDSFLGHGIDSDPHASEQPILLTASERNLNGATVRFMVNLATLTGAIIVSLGHHYAGLFANDDELAGRLLEASNVTGEKLWRMPLGPEYDKMIDSKNADMKNIAGGRYGGAIIAAQFLKRFVKETPWAHLDIAGTAIGAPGNDINQSWGTGFGVRLLDRLVRDHYED